MPSSIALRSALAISVVFNLLQLFLKYKEKARWRSIRMFKAVLQAAVAAAGHGATCSFTVAINGASMQLRPGLDDATRQLSRAIWLQQEADPGLFHVDFLKYKLGTSQGNKTLVAIECAVFYGQSDVPFETINAKRHHISLFQVEGAFTQAEKESLPVLYGHEARGYKLYSGNGVVCKTSLLVDVTDGFLDQIAIFIDSVGAQWAPTTSNGTKIHISL